MSAQTPVDQGKSEQDPNSPEHEQDQDHGRSKVSQKGVLQALLFELLGQGSIGLPGYREKEPGKSKAVSYPSREDYGFKGV